MSEIEPVLTSPENDQELQRIIEEVTSRMNNLGLRITRNLSPGGFTTKHLNFNVENNKQVKFDFLIISFAPDGWHALANQNSRGLAVLDSLRIALDRGSYPLKVVKIENKYYATSFPKHLPR